MNFGFFFVQSPLLFNRIVSLYTKYRPKDWESIVGQDNIVTILRASLREGRVGHAYIFTGSRGTGKTTSARILAKGINCLNLQDGNPCHTCANCQAFDNGTMLDVIEIDGASNTSVDDVRDLIERAKFEPTQGKYKIYIIDEVHMLSTGAFNALLKTLEEPPAHVKFILATTEIHKVPETIRSRCIRFDCKKIPTQDIINRLLYVAQEEGIQTESKAIELIAQAARGGMRDALTLLEQNISAGHLTLERVSTTLDLMDGEYIDRLIEAIRVSDQKTVLDIISDLKDRHIEARSLFDQILFALRDKMLQHFGKPLFGEYDRIFLYFRDAYGSLRSLPDGMLLVELTLLRATQPSIEVSEQVSPPKAAPTPPQDTGTTIEKTTAIPKENPPKATPSPDTDQDSL